jgi:hypothetical protein
MELPPLAPLFAAFSPLDSFLFSNLQTLFCRVGGGTPASSLGSSHWPSDLQMQANEKFFVFGVGEEGGHFVFGDPAGFRVERVDGL